MTWVWNFNLPSDGRMEEVGISALDEWFQLQPLNIEVDEANKPLFGLTHTQRLRET